MPSGKHIFLNSRLFSPRQGDGLGEFCQLLVQLFLHRVSRAGARRELNICKGEQLFSEHSPRLTFCEFHFPHNTAQSSYLSMDPSVIRARTVKPGQAVCSVITDPSRSDSPGRPLLLLSWKSIRPQPQDWARH